MKTDDMPQTLTDEIAFELGRFDPQVFHPFYDSPMWRISSNPTFRYVAFFKWNGPSRASGDGENWEWYLFGTLNESLFVEPSHKQAYIRGQIAAQGKVTSESIHFSWANSIPTRDRVKLWMSDLIHQDGPYYLFSGHSFESRELMSCPTCVSLTLKAGPEIISLFQGPYVKRERPTTLLFSSKTK